MDKEMSRGDTMLISIDAPTEYPVTTLQDVRMSIKQGHNETLIPLSEFQLVTIPETGNQEYQYVISQEMSLGFEETRKHGYKVEISLVWLNQSGTRRQDPHKTVYKVYPTIYDDVMSGDSPIEPPDDYSGATEVTPSTETQVLPTKNRIVLDDITIYPAPTESLATNENGTFLPSNGNVGFSEVVVDVEPSLESLSVTENGLYLPESGTDGFGRVNVNVLIPTFKTEEKTVTENGVYYPSAGKDGISKVTVDVPPTVPVLQGKAVNPSETAQHVEPDSGYDGLSAVDVGAIPSSYVGSGITRRSGSDLTASGNTVNVPSGYYESSGSKTVQSGSAGTPTASKSAVSNNAVTVTPSVSNTEGYISGGTKTGNAVTVSASELVSGTKQVIITSNGTTTEDVTAYASAQISVNVVNEDYEDALVALGVTEDLTDGIEALTTYANGVTGESDTTLSDAVASLADGYGQGSGYTGIEVKTDSNGYITDYIFHGFSKIPKYALNYASYSRAPSTGIPVISFADKPTSCGIMAFNRVTASIEWSGLSELEKVEGEYALAPNYSPGNNQSAQIVNLPKFKGYIDNTYSAQNVFRMQSNNYPYAPLTYNLPVCEIIPQYAWYNLAGTGASITLGSIGHAVTESKQQPFGSTSNASGTVTIYTDGAHLDALKTAVQQNAGTNLAFVYKASEATTYNNISYAAGDTILTSTPS